MIYSRDVYVEYIGIDAWDRKIYVDLKTDAWYLDVNIENDIGNFKRLYTVDKDGQPIAVLEDTRIILKDEQMNTEIANKIAQFLIKEEYGHDTSIYFNNMCYLLNHNTISICTNTKASDSFEYSNNATVSMTFEGALNHSINGYTKPSLFPGIDSIANEYGYYFELGNAWNMAMYKI